MKHITTQSKAHICESLQTIKKLGTKGIFKDHFKGKIPFHHKRSLNSTSDLQIALKPKFPKQFFDVAFILRNHEIYIAQCIKYVVNKNTALLIAVDFLTDYVRQSVKSKIIWHFKLEHTDAVTHNPALLVLQFRE